MSIWNRNTDDPLMRYFLDKYYLNLLSLPRENVAVGDIYVLDGKKVFPPAGKIMDFIEPPLELPSVTKGENMPDVSGIVSKGVSIKMGMGFLEGFLNAMGAFGIVTKIQAEYEAKKMNVIKFRFAHITRDYMNAMALGGKLIRHQLMEDHPFYDEGYRYYVVTAVIRTKSISIIGEGDQTKSGTVKVGAIKIADVSTGVSVEESSGGEVTFIGEKNLVFGVELYELSYDSKRKKLKYKIPSGAIKVRNKSEPLVKPAFIGGPEDDIFLKVE
jgi:hypothetical protein